MKKVALILSVFFLTSFFNGCSDDAAEDVADARYEECRAMSNSDRFAKDNCWFALARDRNDEQYCNNIIGDYDMADTCHHNIAVATNDIDACDGIRNVSKRDDCDSDVARATGNVSLCERIQDPIKKTNCAAGMGAGIGSIVDSSNVVNTVNMLRDGYALFELDVPHECPRDINFEAMGGAYCKHRNGTIMSGWAKIQLDEPMSGKIWVEAGSFGEGCQGDACGTSGGLKVMVHDADGWGTALGVAIPDDSTIRTYTSEKTYRNVRFLYIGRGAGGPARSDVRVYSLNVE